MNDIIINAPVTVYASERKFIEEFVMGVKFPWYWQGQQTFNDPKFFNQHLPEWLRPHLRHYNGPFLSHTLLYRAANEHVVHTERSPNDISPYFEFFLEIFHRFMREQGLTYNRVYRANLNLNWYNGDHHTEPHLDHDYPHYNFIMYLDSCDQGQTIVWPEDFSVSYMIPAVQYTAVTFKQQWHAHRYPRMGQRRTVFVVTYGVDQ